MKSRAKSGYNENFISNNEANDEQINYYENEKVRNRSRQQKEQDQEIEDQSTEVDKYEKSAGASQNTNNQRNFIYSHLTMLKIYSLVVLFLSALNLIFSILFMQVYKL